jgi:16S rRNA (uracil1498-N3)-methyltransferase
MITNFYTSHGKIGKDTLTVDGDEARHILSVFRYGPGDRISVVDGRGTKYQAEIVKTSRNSLEAKILSRTRMENEPRCRVTLAQAVCRQERMDFLIEKTTEIGVSSIIPILTQRGMVKVSDSLQQKRKTERWQRIAVAAMKQSLRTVLPEIKDFTEFDDLVAESGQYGLCLVASLEEGLKRVSECRQLKKGLKDVLLIVGPEAGFTDDELSKAKARGAIPVSLGVRRLRAETAGVVFSSLVLQRLADLG